VRVWSVADRPLDLDVAFAGSLHWKLAGAAGKEVKPAAGPTTAPAEPRRWFSLQPGRTAGKIVGATRWDEAGHVVLELASRRWTVAAGKYTLHCTLKVARGGPAGIPARRAKSAWTGEMALAPAQFEVFAEVSDERLRAMAASVRREHAAEPKEKLWRALTKLVTPGMTLEQMLIALPPAPRQRPKIEDHPGYFFVSYPLDLEFAVKAVGVRPADDKGLRVLTSRPRLIPKPAVIDDSSTKK
jgi:hypothetical protein